MTALAVESAPVMHIMTAMRSILLAIVLMICLGTPLLGADQTQVRYDDQQRITQLTTTEGTHWMYTRDPQGRLISVAIAGKVWTVAYDPDGGITAIRSPEGPVECRGATAVWVDLALVLRSPGKPDRILVGDPRR